MNRCVYQVFYDHIKAHFEKEHPDWEVCCKICGKTFRQILDDYVSVEDRRNQTLEKST